MLVEGLQVVLLSFHERSRKLDPDKPSPDDERDEAFSCPACPPLTTWASHAAGGSGGNDTFADEVRGPSTTIDALLGTP